MYNTNKFTGSMRIIMEKSKEIACELGSKYIGSEHLLLGILWVDNSTGAKVLSSKGIDYIGVKKIVSSFENGEIKFKLSTADITPMVKEIITSSLVIAEQWGHELIGSEHLLQSIVSKPECVALKIINMFNVSAGEIKSALRDYDLSYTKSEKRNDSQTKQKNQSYVDRFAKNLCDLARKGELDPVIARDKEIDRIIGILCRRTKNNPCLVGNPGVGKTAVVEGLAIKIIKKQVPSELWSKEIYTLELSSMIAGAKYRGDFEERMKGIIDEAGSNPNIVLFIDEIHTLMGAGSAEGAMDAANILKPALARARIQVIGATTYKEYQKHIEKDAALERRFQSVQISEPSIEDAKEMVMGLVEKYQNHHGVKIPKETVDCAVELSKIYLPDKYLPDKAIDLIDEACAVKRLNNTTSADDEYEESDRFNELEKKKENAVLDKNFRLALDIALMQSEHCHDIKKSPSLSINCNDIENVIFERTGIPIKKIGEYEHLKNLSERLKDSVIGQDEAIERVVNSIKRGRTGLKNINRPIGSFMFLGSSGVGKTKLALEIAKEMFNSEGAICRLDMSEFMEKHSISRLIGSPPGYVGFDEGGLLTSHLKKHPYTVVLFDEIEKAHPEIFNILLQILDAGRLTDSKGGIADFSNAIIIMTSNIGTNYIKPNKIKGFTENNSELDSEDVIMTSLKKHFSPEFLNRIDEIIIFNQLTDKDIDKIIYDFLSEVVQKTFKIGIEVVFEESVREFILNKCDAENYGARGIKRTIQKYVENKIAKLIIDGDIAAPCRIIMSSDMKDILCKSEVSIEK